MSTVVLVMGMHRSGTSMVTRLLNSCGLYLGNNDDLIPAQPENSEGYWENRHFVHLNEDLLTALHVGWDVPPFSELWGRGWSNRAEVQPFYPRAEALIREFDGQSCWGWKDPRNSITFAFWQRLIPHLKPLICIRNPMEIVASLMQRGITLENGFALCLRYYEFLATACEQMPVVITHYDTYFYDAESELERVTTALGLSVRSQDIEQAVQTIFSALHRQVTPPHIANKHLPSELAQHYRAFCEQAGTVCQRMYSDVNYQYEALQHYSLLIYDKLRTTEQTSAHTIYTQTQQLAQQQRDVERLKGEVSALTTQMTEAQSLYQQHLNVQAQQIAQQLEESEWLKGEISALTTQMAQAQAAHQHHVNAQVEKIAQQQGIIDQLNSSTAVLTAQFNDEQALYQRLLMEQAAALNAELMEMRSTKGWRTLELWWRIKAGLINSRPYQLLRTSALITMQEGPSAFSRQLGRWLRGERRYYQRQPRQPQPAQQRQGTAIAVTTVTAVPQATNVPPAEAAKTVDVPETADAVERDIETVADELHLEWSVPMPDIADYIAGVYAIRGVASATTGVKSIEMMVNTVPVAIQPCIKRKESVLEFEFLWDVSLLAAGAYAVSIQMISVQGNTRELHKTLWVHQH